MTTMAEVLSKEREKDERIIQSELGKAIHQSFQAIVREQVPNRMALLLLQLAAAQVVKPHCRAREASIPTAVGVSESKLDRATRHVARAKLLIARQRERVAQLQAEDRPIADASCMLDTFIQTLEAMEHHQGLLREEAEGKDQKPEWIFSRLAARALAA
ncbi:hypothetical protein [Methylocystis parvus]|uniref:hypothetical protein n=1 Tax=Methylocystis parvus TaxID=134 RepID=UPI003C750043